MKSLIQAFCWVAVTLFITVEVFADRPVPPSSQNGDDVAPAISATQIEADWVRQEQVRRLDPSPRDRPEASQPQLTTRQDAAGGNDGVVDGTYGFHTGRDEQAWWQVDLAKPEHIGQIVLYKSGSDECSLPFDVIGSVDGRTGFLLCTISQHADNNCWRIQLDDTKARFIRLQTRGSGKLALAEVEVYRNAH